MSVAGCTIRVMSLGVGEQFAGYTIVRTLGAGGMGEVYLAQHPRLPRYDALKVLRADVSTDPVFRERFLREADLTAKLWNPHIVGVHDRGDEQGRLWISMEFVDGEDAGQLLARKFPVGMPVDLVVAIVTAVGDALDYAHKQGLLHRDVKPANILLAQAESDSERRILLTDFGIARARDEASRLTATNTAMGTLAYCAPEQLMGKDIDGRADQYALAASAYTLLVGATPFPDSTPATAIDGHLNSPPPRLSAIRPELAVLDPVLGAGMAKDPNGRFASCADFARALDKSARAAAAVGSASAPTAAAPIPDAQPHETPEARATRIEEPARATSGRAGLPMIAAGAAVALVAAVIAFIAARASTQEAPVPGAAPPQPAIPTVVRNPPTVTVMAPPSVPETVTVTASPAPPRIPRQEMATGDLGLSVPMTRPACNGMGIVVLGSVTTPGQYAAGVQRYLDAYPGASYLRTDLACPSLRQESDGGNPIYAVFYPAGNTPRELCAAVRKVGGDAYGKWLDTTTPPDEQITC